jgi:hypothetical protein
MKIAEVTNNINPSQFELFFNCMATIETTHKKWFLDDPLVNNIVYETSGEPYLRFREYSEVPVHIQDQCKKVFDLIFNSTVLI